MSTKGSSGNSIDAKREEFRKYLDKEGVLEYLTKQLVRLYEEADKPSNALDYLKNNFNGKETEVAQLKADNLEKENVQLKERIKVLESEKAELESRVKELSEASTANNTVINSPATQPETSKDNVTEKTDEDEPMDGVEDQSSSKPATEDKSEAPSASEDLTQGDAATSDSKQDNLEASEDAKQEGVASDSAMESSTATNTNEMKSDAEENPAVQV